MKGLYYLTFCFIAAFSVPATAQKPFSEGSIVYKVTLDPQDHNVITGFYTFTLKEQHIRKEIKLSNGYQDVVLIDCGASKVYSLRTKGGKKYAIELSMSELMNMEEKFKGFVLEGEVGGKKNIAGCVAVKGKVNYKDGTSNEIYYCKDWKPLQGVTFERFPDAGFLPLYFSYRDDKNMAMEFTAEKVVSGPIENSVFGIPVDYKIISNKEYKELTR